MDLEALALSELIDQLPDGERTVINALFYERISEREVATREGVTQRTVQRRRSKALVHLRAGLVEGMELLS